MQLMQNPTCTSVRIRSTQDAHKIFFAVQQGLLHMVTRRLDADERLALGTGCVYAWEERGPHTEITGLGIERFTEGRRWSPSRVRDEFLFYYEKYTPPPDANHSGAEKQPPRDWDPLVKQTYSVWVETEKGRRKWHLTAYFTQATVDQLGTIDDIDGVRDLVVPDGLFKSTRVGKSRGKADEQAGRSSDVLKPSTTVTRTYAAFPSPYPGSNPGLIGSSPSMQPVLMYEPYQSSHTPGYGPSDLPSPQYSASSPLYPPQRSLPPIREPTRRTAEHPERSIPSPQQQYSDYNRVGSRLGSMSINPSHKAHRSAHGYPSVLPPLHSEYDHHHSVYGSPNVLPHPHSPQAWYASPVQDFNHDLPHMDSHSDAQASYTLRSSYPPSDHSTMGSSNPYPHSTDMSNLPPPAVDLQSHLHPQMRGHPQAHTRPRSPLSRDPRSLYANSDPRQTSLPPLMIPEHSYPSPLDLQPANDTPHSDARRGSIGPCRDLAPLNALTRAHPYRRDPVDDRTLRLLGPRSS